jgi:predicted MarR family transcription regulator
MKRIPTNPPAASPAAAAPGHRIVTSQHLVSAKSPELSEVEFGLAIAHNAYSRWMLRCMTAAGFPDLAALDVLVLHHVNSQDQEKKLADICFVLNVEDTHVVSYALKKLVGMGLLEGSKRGKEVFFRTTGRGRDACWRYRQVRETCLMPGFAGTPEENARLGDAASLLRTLSGRYDQAARAAAASVFTSLDAGAAPALVPPPAPRRSAPEAS